MSKPFLPYLETMLSNACTLACENCTNYSDYHMKGSLRFADYEPVIDAWLERIRIGCIGFIGGEPMINPELKTFMYETHRKTNKSVMLVTNGTMWHRWPDFMNFIKDMGSVHLKFSVHQPGADYIENAIQDVLGSLNWKTETKEPDLEKYYNNNYRLHFTIDRNNLFTRTWQGNSYYDMKPYNNDPIQAHEQCTQTWCPLLYKERLYKCSSVALLYKVLEDHFLKNDADWLPYLNYKGIGLEDTDIQIKEWIDNYAQPHNICSMCPTSHNNAFFSHWDKVKLK